MGKVQIFELDGDVESLMGADVSGLNGAEVLALITDVERLQRRLCSFGTRLVAEVESRRLAGDYARSTTAELLITTLRISPDEARARSERAAAVGPRSTLTGEALPPLLPVAGRAAADGAISGEHVDVVIDCLDHVPSTLPVDALCIVEATLVEAARHEHPRALRRTAALLLARLDADGTEPREDRTERDRELTLTRYSDGSGRLRGRLTPEAAAVWETVIDASSAPAPAEDGLRDDRTAAQRRHDGLLDAGHRLLRSGTLPAAGGVPVTVLIRTTAADFATAATGTGTGARTGTGRTSGGIATSDRGDVLDLGSMLAAMGEAELIPVRIGHNGSVLDLGRSRRLATRAQRLALVARDGGCTFPACDRPAAWAEVHHVVPWQDGGSTDLDNMCLLCRFHHREFERRGWQVQMNDGVPEWIPPSFIDPLRTPRRNHAHHPPDLDFGLSREPAA